MRIDYFPFADLLSNVIDNRGKTCPTAERGVSLIATNCIRNDLLYPAYDNVRYVSQETYNTWFRGHPVPGDLIFVTKGTPGRVCVAPDPIDFCIAQDMVAIRADEQKVYPRYLFALLRSPVVQMQIEQMHVGTLIPHFKKGDFDKLLLPVLDREAQVFIGDSYFELSKKIDLNRRMNETLEAMARAIFKSWFMDFDPVRAKADRRPPVGMDSTTAALFPDSFDDSALGRIPRGWLATTLGQAIDINDSRRIPLSGRERARRKGPYPYYGAASVMDSVDDYLFDGIYVLVGEDGSVVNDDGTPVVQYVWGKFWVNNHAHVLQAKNGVGLEYLLLFLRHVNVRPFVTGAVQPKLNQRNLCAIPFVLPSADVSAAFTESVSILYARLRAGCAESQTFVTIRDALLPKLLSGEIRLEDAEKFVGAAT